MPLAPNCSNLYQKKRPDTQHSKKAVWHTNLNCEVERLCSTHCGLLKCCLGHSCKVTGYCRPQCSSSCWPLRQVSCVAGERRRRTCGWGPERLVVIMEHSASSVYAGGKKSLWVRFVQIPGHLPQPARSMAFSAVLQGGEQATKCSWTDGCGL